MAVVPMKKVLILGLKKSGNIFWNFCSARKSWRSQTR